MISRLQAFHFRIGIELIEVGNAECEAGVGEELHGPASVEPMKSVSMPGLSAPS